MRRRPRKPRRHWPRPCRRGGWSCCTGACHRSRKSRSCSASSPAQTQLLVATTVIEVGVDVPNASLMVIENAERMGLAQLHQLRGRVGRGSTTATACCCIARHCRRWRARAWRRSATPTMAFKIAHRDLELRGPGELLGRRQTGLAQLRVADLSRDADLLAEVRAAAAQMIENGPRSRGGFAAALDRRAGAVWTRRLSGRWAHRSAADAAQRAPGRAAELLRAQLALAQLMRLDRPIGIWLLLWPTLWALWIAAAGIPAPAAADLHRRHSGDAQRRLRHQRSRRSQHRSARAPHAHPAAGRAPGLAL